MNWQKLRGILNIVFGTIAATYIGGYYFFCGGVRDIITNIVVVGGTCSIATQPLVIGCLKLAVANAVFTFILYASVGLGIKEWTNAQT